ncbi:MAG: hypothetical protein K8I00_05015 [Candidatus Omnitrophica bacterium]|nr:hypothetical protein [Candidatus Omnitrophota bacterium]
MIFAKNGLVRLQLMVVSVVLCIVIVTRVEAAEKIIYSQLTDGYWQLLQMETDGSNARQLTTTKYDKRDAVCAEQGKTILYRTNNGQLKMLNPNTNVEEDLLSKYNRVSNPEYCGAEKKIMFVRYDPRGLDISDIWTADINGDNPRVVTRDHRLKYQPAYNRDCSRITFIQADADDKSAHQVWVMDSDGQNQQQLTTDKALAAGPQFLLEEDSIIFASNREGKDYEIYGINMANGHIKQLTNNARLDNGPSISPQTGRIAFVSNRAGLQQIWSMTADGAEQTALGSSDHEAVDPAWCSEITTGPQSTEE